MLNIVLEIDISAWYEKYGPMVIRRCRYILRDAEDAQDAVHDVFLNLLRGKNRLHGSYPSSLLYTMATNICLNRLRKKKREIPGNFTEMDEIKFFYIDEGYNKVEADLLLEEILKDESEINRTIYFMYHADRMTLKEIGGVVGFSVSGVKKRLEAFKARIRLKTGTDKT